MSHPAPRRDNARRIIGLAAIGMLLATAIFGFLLHQSTSSSAASLAPMVPDASTTTADGAVTEADGVLPDGVTVFDDHYAGVRDLDPDLLRALRAAATDAAADGIDFFVNSGWRSPEYQDQLLHDAVSTYGSEAEAARWVATANTSAHVSGDAVDIGQADATTWLSDNGARYGLCPIYDNEPWHFELRSDAIDRGCPAPYADPTQDPRMQQ